MEDLGWCGAPTSTQPFPLFGFMPSRVFFWEGVLLAFRKPPHRKQKAHPKNHKKKPCFSEFFFCVFFWGGWGAFANGRTDTYRKEPRKAKKTKQQTKQKGNITPHTNNLWVRIQKKTKKVLAILLFFSFVSPSSASLLFSFSPSLFSVRESQLVMLNKEDTRNKHRTLKSNTQRSKKMKEKHVLRSQGYAR